MECKGFFLKLGFINAHEYLLNIMNQNYDYSADGKIENSNKVRDFIVVILAIISIMSINLVK